MGQEANGRSINTYLIRDIHHNMASQASGSYIDSFTSRMLQPDDGNTPNAEEQDIIKWCSGALYAGGADTVSL